jgi:hypothetical protein
MSANGAQAMADVRPRLNAEIYREIRIAAINCEAQLRQPVTVPQLIAAAIKVANQHPGELLIALQGDNS